MQTNASRPAKMLAVLTAVALTTVLTACKSSSGPSTENVTLNGGGSTFVNPVMSRWTHDFAAAHTGTQINYQSIGSGGGVQQVKAGTVDFGASDYPLTDANLAEMKPMLQIPETAGPVCITYNLPGLTKPLQLSAEAISGIFLGKITSWQDPILKKDNPGVALPNIKVVVAHRTDGSGTTAAFTTYLSAVSPEWSTKVGKGGAVSWPVGLGGKGSEGVTAQVRQSPGGIGYVELIYAQQNNLAVANVRNQAGNYITPSTASTTAAIAAFADQLNKDPRVPIVNAPASAPEAYPISTLTFLIIPKDGTDVGKRTMLKKFIQYIVTDGQLIASQLNYAPLPDGVKQYDQQQLSQMTVNGQPVQ
ncbi:phosphate-binding protein [Edaphobacter acidisoli]|uniref:Phosphate-binding protein n=1 Tax=Edaphobacter acidisoli TaxID=2040573 RepID=A0A916RN73_9BACT|nr:phosphate ABC transporter substrate-binding protein PstS [Edaphobacter acidisoli]GGA61500.1 phosphate-binding protein [Edaphobacter acidisoli]